MNISAVTSDRTARFSSVTTNSLSDSHVTHDLLLLRCEEKSETCFLLIQCALFWSTRQIPRIRWTDLHMPLYCIVDCTGVCRKCFRSSIGQGATSMCQGRRGHENAWIINADADGLTDKTGRLETVWNTPRKWFTPRGEREQVWDGKNSTWLTL